MIKTLRIVRSRFHSTMARLAALGVLIGVAGTTSLAHAFDIGRPVGYCEETVAAVLLAAPDPNITRMACFEAYKHYEEEAFQICSKTSGVLCENAQYRAQYAWEQAVICEARVRADNLALVDEWYTWLAECKATREKSQACSQANDPPPSDQSCEF